MNKISNKKFADKVIKIILNSRPSLENIQSCIFNTWSSEESKNNEYLNLGIAEFEYMRNTLIERLS